MEEEESWRERGQYIMSIGGVQECLVEKSTATLENQDAGGCEGQQPADEVDDEDKKKRETCH